jgi:hypothetical protein
MGEGWGEGVIKQYLRYLHTPPLNPLPPGEGKWDFLRNHYTLNRHEKYYRTPEISVLTFWPFEF